MDEPTAGSELVCVCATKISNPACILHPGAMGSCFSQQFLRKTMRGRIKISCPVTCVKIECVCISLGARQRRIIGSQSPSRKGRHNTNMTLFIEGEDINCSRGLKKMLREDGVTCCLEFPVPPHLRPWAPELLTRNVSYLESSVISRSWKKVVQERSYRTPGRMRLLRAQLQLFLRDLVCTPWISGQNSTTGSDMGSGTCLQTMPKSPFLTDLDWILSELQLGDQLRPSEVVEMMYRTAQETAQKF